MPSTSKHAIFDLNYPILEPRLISSGVFLMVGLVFLSG